MIGPVLRWLPAGLLGFGAVFTVGVDTQRALDLRAPLDGVVPRRVAEYEGREVALPPAQARAAGFDDYLLRQYTEPAGPDGAGPDRTAGAPWFSLYVGYYGQQMQGRTIHSPKNCLPGAGWEALAHGTATVPLAEGPVTVNRYLLQRDDDRALVLYWYQGRGRVAWNEYAVKWDLLRDAALEGRSDEALVRIVVPITGSEESALELAVSAASEVIPALETALPAT